MAAGQNNNNYPKNPNGPDRNRGRRPSGGARREKVPGAVKAIYVMAALLILAICALVFVVTLKATGWNGTNQKDPSGVVIGNSDDSDSSGDKSGAGDGSSGSGTHDVSFTSYEDSNSDPWVSASDVSDSWTASADDPSGSGNTVIHDLPENYDETLFKDDLFIGDSIFTGLHLYGYLNVKNVAAAVGYTPYKAMNSAFSQGSAKSAKDYALDMQPKRIFIMLGSNAMGAGTNYDRVVSQYAELVDILKNGCKDSLICVISVPPVTKNSSSAANAKISNDDIDSMNVKLKKMAKDAGVEWYDLNSLLSDDDGYFIEEYAEMDGLHFLGRTYKVLLSALQREVIEKKGD